MIDANRANRAKGPAGNLGSRLRAELAKRGQKLAILGGDDVARLPAELTRVPHHCPRPPRSQKGLQ
jgi:hypothetical protein